MKKILFFACDPGGANTLIPLIEPLAKTRKVLIFGKSSALKKYQENGYKGADVIKRFNKNSLAEVIKFLQQQSPDVVVTGTSANDMTEKYLWRGAQRLGIPALAILDQWVNYGIRFSKYGLKDIKKYEKNKKQDYLPTKILVMDDYAKKQLIKEGIDGKKIVITGNPHFEKISKSRKIFTKEKINKLKQSLGLTQSDLVVLFVSEPLAASYSDSKKYWGFSEEEILLAIIDALAKLTWQTSQAITLIVKLHPKENRDRFEQMIKNLPNPRINIIIEHDRPPLGLIMLADLICGMFSIILQEAVILGKPILSVTIGLKRKNVFVLENMGLAKSILSKRELNDKLEKIVIKKQVPKIKFAVEPRAITKVIKAIKKYV
jgi:hypothetical protein